VGGLGRYSTLIRLTKGNDNCMSLGVLLAMLLVVGMLWSEGGAVRGRQVWAHMPGERSGVS
jgi:hypothetical protein